MIGDKNEFCKQDYVAINRLVSRTTCNEAFNRFPKHDWLSIAMIYYLFLRHVCVGFHLPLSC